MHVKWQPRGGLVGRGRSLSGSLSPQMGGLWELTHPLAQGHLQMAASAPWSPRPLSSPSLLWVLMSGPWEGGGQPNPCAALAQQVAMNWVRVGRW